MSKEKPTLIAMRGKPGANTKIRELLFKFLIRSKQFGCPQKKKKNQTH